MKSIEAGASSSSEMEFIGEAGFLKRHITPGPYRLSPSFTKNDKDVLALELTKCLGTNWAREEIPNHWCESMIASIYKKLGKSSCKITPNLV